MTARFSHKQRPGFTLVEILVVIAIIGILVAILVPVAGVVITRSKEAKISFEVQQLSMALDQYKTEFGTYPIDMSNPFLLQAHVNKLSRNHKHGVVFDQSTPYNPATWYGAALPNPHFGEPGQPQFRFPYTMDRAEALVFFLHEVNTSSDYPLGYWQPDPSDLTIWAPVTTEHRHFFDLKDTQLRDYDNDGWEEYAQAAGPEVPLVYFDARSYMRPDFHRRPNRLIPNNLETYDQAQNPVNADAVIVSWQAKGFPQPYWQQWDLNTGWPAINGFVEPEKFQLIAAGMDGDFGEAYAQDTSAPGVFKGFNKARQQYTMDRGELDGMSSFSDGRLDKDYDQ